MKVHSYAKEYFCLLSPLSSPTGDGVICVSWSELAFEVERGKEIGATSIRPSLLPSLQHQPIHPSPSFSSFFPAGRVVTFFPLPNKIACKRNTQGSSGETLKQDPLCKVLWLHVSPNLSGRNLLCRVVQQIKTSFPRTLYLLYYSVEEIYPWQVVWNMRRWQSQNLVEVNLRQNCFPEFPWNTLYQIWYNKSWLEAFLALPRKGATQQAA